MGNIVDRRQTGTKKAQSNRHRFLKRIKRQIKKAIPDIVQKENIKDLTSGRKEVKIPVKGTKQPKFTHDTSTGNKKITRHSNKHWNRGDRIPKPEGGAGRGRGNKPGEGSGEDDFVVIISREEFLDYFFDDLELPNMIKQFFKKQKKKIWKRKGLSPSGIMPRLNLARSMRQSIGRRIAVKNGIEERLEEIERLLQNDLSDQVRSELIKEKETLEKRLENIPFLDDFDLRFNRLEQEEVPITAAVMFCVMDVSASMGYKEKDLAKRFFTLLYLFLTKEYEEVELVFIMHHYDAMEVDEDTFFNSNISGGTRVYPALELAHDIMKKRYSKDWNIYMVQASDGDVWAMGDRSGNDDASLSARTLEQMKSMLQAAFYVEIMNDWAVDGTETKLWQGYQNLDWLHRSKIKELTDIWPVFKELFKKQKAEL